MICQTLMIAATVVTAAPLAEIPAGVTHAEIEELLQLDTDLEKISRRLADIDNAYEFIDNNYQGDGNPYPWEPFPHRPTLRDRKKSLQGARSAISRTIRDKWAPP